MTIKITDPIYGPYYNMVTLFSFLESVNLEKGLSNKKKDALIEFINTKIESNEIKNETIINWQRKLLHEGNKHFVNLKYDISENVDYTECINTIKESCPAYFDHEVTDDIIELYFNEIFYEKEDNESIQINRAEKNFIVIVKIDTSKKTYSISFLPPSEFCIKTNDDPLFVPLSSAYLINQYKKIINDHFKFHTNSNRSEYIDVLSHIWKITNDAILEELSPITNNLATANDEYINCCFNSIFSYEFAKNSFADHKISELDFSLIEDDKIKAEILNKLITTWISFFISESKIPFEFKNEYGILLTESLQTFDGAKVKYRAKSTPLFNYKLHHDIVGNSLSETHACDEMQFIWLYKDREIKTTLSCHNDYFYILFHRKTLKEEIDYVLSTIESIKDEIQRT